MRNVKQQVYYVVAQILRMKSANQPVDVESLLLEEFHEDELHIDDVKRVVEKVKELITYIENV